MLLAVTYSCDPREGSRRQAGGTEGGSGIIVQCERERERERERESGEGAGMQNF